MKLNKFWQEYKVLILIIGIGLVPRLIAGFYLGNKVESLPGIFDQISYHKLAIRLVDGHGFSFGELWWPLTRPGEPTAHWSYLYSVYLAAIYRFVGTVPVAARILQIVLVGILQPTLAFLIGRHVFGKSVGLVAAALTAVYGYFIYYSAALMTESFYITGIMASLYLAIRLAETESTKQQRRLALGLGVTLGLTILLRQLFILFIPVLLLWLVWAYHRRTGRLPIKPVIIVTALIIIFILPFTIYNYMRFQQFVLLNTNAGFAFYWGNHPIYGTRFEPILPEEMGRYQDLIPTELRHLNEAALDRELMSRGIQNVLEDPGRYVLLSLSRIPPYFMFWPSAESSMISNVARLLSFGILWPFMLYGLLYVVFRRKSYASTIEPIFLLIIFAGFYTFIHILSWALIRYRLPVDAVLLIFAALTLSRIWQHVKSWKLRHSQIRASQN